MRRWKLDVYGVSPEKEAAVQTDSLSPLAKELFSRLDKVLDTAGPAARTMFEWTVTQVQVEAAVKVGGAILGVAFALGLSVIMKKASNTVDKFADEDVAVLKVLSVVAPTIAVLVFIVVFMQQVPVFFNPEYAAVVKLLTFGSKGNPQ